MISRIAIRLATVLFTLPYAGRLLHQIWNGLLEGFWRLVRLPDLLLQPRRHGQPRALEIAIYILRDERLVPTIKADDLDKTLERAARIFSESAGVTLRVAGIQTLAEAAPAGCLDHGCGVRSWLNDLGRSGSYFFQKAAELDMSGTLRRLSGLTSAA